MSKRIANCRGRTTAHFGRVRYGRFHVTNRPAPVTPVQHFEIERAEKPTRWGRVKQFFRRGVR